jgi:cytochrome oxidase assembly protein ShyY1
VPVFATIIVLAAVATMVALGIWQLGRAKEKDALLARYQAAAGLPPIDFPTQAMLLQAMPLFRRSKANCLQPVLAKAVAGRSQQGQTGFAHWVDCRTGAEGPGLRVDIGWSERPVKLRWAGGVVVGTIAPDKERGMRLVSEQGMSGLQPSAPTDVSEVPNNHRSYAFQWFAFALSALVIYALALKGRSKERP